MIVEIERYDPDQERCWVDSYEISMAEQHRMTVMDLLDYISTHLDPSLAYYHHSVCNHGICGRCALAVNGKNGLACLTTVDPLPCIHLAPAKGRQVVRDLVTK